MPYLIHIGGHSTKISLNCKPMFEHSFGHGIEKLDNMTGRQAYSELWPAVAMIYRPDDYDLLKKMEPVNNFGNLKEARHFLVDLMELCSDNPEEIVSVQS